MLESDRQSSESREVTPDTDSGYNATVIVKTSSSNSTHIVQHHHDHPQASGENGSESAQKVTSKVAMPVPEAVTTETLTAQTSAIVNEIRLRQQHHHLQHKHQQPEMHYANLGSHPQQPPPPPHRDQKPGNKTSRVMVPTLEPLNGPSSSLEGQSLAAQLKSRLAERRRSEEANSTMGPFVPDSLVADIQQAVRTADENGMSFNGCANSLWNFKRTILPALF